tara:strand:+ start:8357 stop:8515 length:159 start_codon:yes stop_codon:yes gene_type:complete
MSKRKGKTNSRMAIFHEINKIDGRLKKKKIRENEEETKQLLSQRKTLTSKLK